MNESSLTPKIPLKTIVERAVRPVRASINCKRKMREELLAHVIAVYEEEAAALGDGSAALVRTVERFGSPTELTGQFQTSVSAVDRLPRLIEYVVDFRSGETTMRRASRFAAMMFAAFGVAILPVFVVQHRLREWPIILAAAALMFCFTLLTGGMRDSLYRPKGRSWWRVALVVVASALLVPAVTFGLCLIYCGDVTSSLASVRPLIPLAIVIGWPPVVLIACMTERELCYRREWENLRID